MKLVPLIMTVIIALGIITQLTQLRKDGKALKAEPDPQIKRKEVRFFVIFVVIGITGALLIRENQEDKSKKTKIEKVDNREIYPTRSKMPDISQEKKSDTITHTSKIEPVKEINTTEKIENKNIDTTLQVVSRIIETTSLNKIQSSKRKVAITQPLPEKGRGLLIVRQVGGNIHNTRIYINDRDAWVWLEKYDSLSGRPSQQLFHLLPGLHNLKFKDAYGVLYDKNIYIKEGATYIKYLKHEYPYGENIGRFIIYPSKKKKECKIAITSLNTYKTDTLYIKERPLQLDLDEGEYNLLIIPLNPSPLHTRKLERISVGMGHLDELFLTELLD